MRILVSAYACDPYLGSEPGVGWTAVCRIAKQHDVWVLTHTRHEENWDKARAEGLVPANVQVRFFGRNRPWIENRLIAHFQSWLSFASFNRQVLTEAQKWHGDIGFDLCHQVTIATWRVASPLWQLPIPFIWGPIGGAGYIPPSFRAMLSPLARVFERIRDLNSLVAVRASSFKKCIQNSTVVFAANEETEEFLKPFRGKLPLIRLPIASLPEEKVKRFQRPPGTQSEGTLTLFAGGNMEGRKGVSLALRALAIVAKAGIPFKYTIAGGGPEIESLKKLASELGISEQVDFHQGFSGQGYIDALHSTDIYFLPSFRESTPVTLLEACLAGCHPIVADTSAQGEIVRMAGGTAVPVINMTDLVEGLAEAVIDCARHREELPSRVEESQRRLIAYFDSARYDETLAEAYRTALRPTQSAMQATS